MSNILDSKYKIKTTRNVFSTMIPLIIIVVIGIAAAVIGYLAMTKWGMKDNIVEWITWPVTLIQQLFGKKEGYGFLGFPGFGKVEYQWMGNNRDHVHPYMAAQEGHGLNCLIPGACDHAKKVDAAFGAHVEPNPTHSTAIDNYNRNRRELQNPISRQVWHHNIGQNVKFPVDSAYVHDPTRVSEVTRSISRKISNGYDYAEPSIPLTRNAAKITIPTNPLVI